MSAWVAVWRIRVAGVAYTTTTLSGLTMQSGRSNVYDQPIAGYCTFNLSNTTGLPIVVNINDAIEIAVQGNAGLFVTLFFGTVTDTGVAVRTMGTTLTQATTITALGAISRLPKTVFAGALAEGLDGAQMLTVLGDTFFNNWSEVDAAYTWATYAPASATWATAENVGLGTVDTGDYTLAAQSANPIDSYTKASALATSGIGYIWEDAQGKVSYADSTHRTQYLVANGYKNLLATNALSAGLRIQTRAGDVRNDITLKYGATSADSVNAVNAASQTIYGRLAQLITTTLKNLADATAQVAFYLSIRATPNANLETITFELINTNISNTERDTLLNVFMGMPVLITALPATMGSDFVGFVEGWKFDASFNTLAITLTLSPLAYSLQSMSWATVAITEQWNTLSPTLDYANAQMVY